MRNVNFESLTIDELLDIRDYTNSLLKKRIGKERREIQKTLDRLSSVETGDAPRGRPRGVRKGRKLAPKFRNPETGETWAGRGARPRWLQAVLKKGRKLDEFAVGKVGAPKKRRAKKRSKRAAR